MQIGEVIRRYRKERGMTQEEMATRLGVTPPAVNKWERGSSMPDIMLLAPIARLLGVTPDTLLSFREELTNEEINQLIQELGKRLKTEGLEQGFQWMKKQLETYPNCETLLWQMIAVFDAKRITERTESSSDEEKYDYYILKSYERLLDSNDLMMQKRAAELLFSLYYRKEEYKKAEEYLTYMSDQDPVKKRMQADIFRNTERLEEAYKSYEELIFSNYTENSILLHSIYLTALMEENKEKARYIVQKQEEHARVFEMGKYQEASSGLELAVLEKNKEDTLKIAREMLDNMNSIYGFTQSPLYQHMSFRDIDNNLFTEVRTTLLKCFQDEETFGYMKDDSRWQKLLVK